MTSGTMDPPEDWDEPVFRREAGKDLTVISGRRVAEEHFTQSLNLGLTCGGPRSQQFFVSRTKPLGGPAYDLSMWAWNLADITARHVRKHDALSIPVDELDWQIEVRQTCERFNWHRAGQHIATNNDAVRAGQMNILQDSLQRGEIGMNVIQRGNPHGPQYLRKPMSSTRVVTNTRLGPIPASLGRNGSSHGRPEW